MRIETWSDVEAVRLARLRTPTGATMPVARLVRELDVSESTYWKGLKLGSALRPSTRSVVRRRLNEMLEGV